MAREGRRCAVAFNASDGVEHEAPRVCTVGPPHAHVVGGGLLAAVLGPPVGEPEIARRGDDGIDEREGPRIRVGVDGRDRGLAPDERLAAVSMHADVLVGRGREVRGAVRGA